MESFEKEILALEQICSKISNMSTISNKIEYNFTRELAFESDRMFGTRLAMEAYYSADTKSERTKIALEISAEAISALILAGIAVVVGLIIKIVSWLSGSKSSSGGSSASDNFTEAKNVIQEVNHTKTSFRVSDNELSKLYSDVGFMHIFESKLQSLSYSGVS